LHRQGNADKTGNIDEVSLLQPEFADIYLTHKYGPFQGHQISSITAYAACLPACLPTHLCIQLTDGHLL
jgi:hypothetical protein